MTEPSGTPRDLVRRTEPSPDCPQRALVDRYLLRELTERDTAQFEQHYFDCTICAEEIRQAGDLLEVMRARAQTTSPERRAGTAGHTSAARWLGDALGLWPFGPRTITVAVLGAAVAVQALVLIPRLHHQIEQRDEPLAFAPTTLRPLTRGEPVHLQAKAGEPFVSVALDVPPSGARAYRVRLLGKGGVLLATISTEPGSAGDPVSLLLPVSRLGPGRYTLELHTVAGETSALLDRYQFVYGP